MSFSSEHFVILPELHVLLVFFILGHPSMLCAYLIMSNDDLIFYDKHLSILIFLYRFI